MVSNLRKSLISDHLPQMITQEWHVRWLIIGNIDIATYILTVSCPLHVYVSSTTDRSVIKMQRKIFCQILINRPSF